ncbi:MAG: hypothetical protein M1465_01240 [Candidatus Marsarchaeota archaeon]|nr:hypothetical protein [Candidatus Marsarchaeota archaeon]
MNDKRVYSKLIPLAVALVLTIIVLYSFSLQVNELGIKPSAIAQAGAARFYENFVYNVSGKIPDSCLVFSYDPTLFNILGKPSAQYYFLYNQSFMSTVANKYSCEIIDYGYWCGTPDNICSRAFNEYKTTPIATATYEPANFTYGLYRITGYNYSPP